MTNTLEKSNNQENENRLPPPPPVNEANFISAAKEVDKIEAEKNDGPELPKMDPPNPATISQKLIKDTETALEYSTCSIISIEQRISDNNNVLQRLEEENKALLILKAKFAKLANASNMFLSEAK